MAGVVKFVERERERDDHTHHSTTVVKLVWRDMNTSKIPELKIRSQTFCPSMVGFARTQ